MVGLTVLAMAVTACGRTGVDVTASEEVESSVEVTESVELSTEGMETELEIEVEVESEGKSETEELNSINRFRKRLQSRRRIPLQQFLMQVQRKGKKR